MPGGQACVNRQVKGYIMINFLEKATGTGSRRGKAVLLAEAFKLGKTAKIKDLLKLVI